MNREFLPEAVLGITVGLLLIVLTVYRTQQPPKAGVVRRAGMVALLVYAVIAAQVLVREGMTWLGVLLLLVLLILASAGSLAGQRRAQVDGATSGWLRRGVAVGLIAAMLIAAGQTLSMVGIVDPRVVVLVIAVVTGLLVAGQGLAASGRIGSLAVWLLIVPVVIALALGLLLGDAGQAMRPIIEVDGVSWVQVVGLVVAFFVLGWSDPGLAATATGQSGLPTRTLIGTGAALLLICAGLLMFFGGAILAPSMQFFVVPANIDALPGLAGVLIAVLTVLFAGLLAATMGGIRETTAGGRGLGLAVAVAVVLALIDPGFDWIVVATSLLAACLIAVRSDRGALLGFAAAVVAVVVLTVTGHMVLGWQSALAVAAVAAVAALLPAATETTVTTPA